MSVIYIFFILVEGVVSALLIAIILLQKSKGGMGGSAFGGGMGEAIFGSRMGNVLTKSTVILGTIFLVNTILLTMLTARRSGSVGSVTDGQVVQQPAMPSPVPPPPAQDAAPIELPAVDSAPAGDAAAPVEIPPLNVKVDAPAEEAAPVPAVPAPEASPSE